MGVVNQQKKNKVDPLETTISWKRWTTEKLTSAQADVGREYMWDMDVGVQREEFGIGIAYTGLKHDLKE